MKINGFDYVSQTPFTRDKKQLRSALQEIVKHGGRRRCESDSQGPVTYAHDQRGVMQWEAYANVSLSNEPEQITLTEET